MLPGRQADQRTWQQQWLWVWMLPTRVRVSLECSSPCLAGRFDDCRETVPAGADGM